MSYESDYEKAVKAWEEKEDALDQLYPGRTRRPFPDKFDYLSAGITLALIMTGMAACILKSGRSLWIF